MKTLLVFFLILANSSAAATALPDAELHRLASYLAYITAGFDPDDPGGIEYVVNEPCVNCQGSGVLGDGKVEFPCEWSDGLYYCNKGKIAKLSDGDAMDYEDIGDALCDTVCECGNCDSNCGGGCCDNCRCGTPEREELFEAIENAPLDFNESTVRELQYDLEQALKEVQTLKATCPNCPTCPPQKQTADQPATTVEEPSCLVDLSQTKWNWSGVSDVPISTMRAHLTNEHSIDPASLDKMSREELIALHNLLHNEEVRATAPEAKASSGSGCPNGRCPTSGSSRSRGFGFFRR